MPAPVFLFRPYTGRAILPRHALFAKNSALPANGQNYFTFGERFSADAASARKAFRRQRLQCADKGAFLYTCILLLVKPLSCSFYPSA